MTRTSSGPRVAARGLAAVLLALVVLSTTGCGTLIGIGAGVVLASSGSSGGHGFVSGPPAPTVTSVSPASASHGGGTSLTVAGTSFGASTSVSLGGVAATNVVVQGATQLTCTAPAFPRTGAVDVVVTNTQGGSGTLASGFAYTNGLPTALVSTVSSPQSQKITLTVTVSDPESDPANLALAVDTGSGVFQQVPASQIVSGDLTAVTTSPAGVVHTLTFDSSFIFAQRNASAVRFQVTPTDTVDGRAGTPGVSNPFSVQNLAPPQLELVQNADDAFDVVVNYRVGDANPGGTINVTGLQWRDLTANRSGNMTVKSGQGLGNVGFSSSLSGSFTKTVWATLADLGYGNNHLVSVTVTVSDGSNSPVSKTSQPFFVSNGPLSDQAIYPTGGFVDGWCVGDVTGDVRSDVVCGRAFGSATDASVGGDVSILVNRGRNFDTAQVVPSPALKSGTIPAPYTGSNPAADPFQSPATHPSEGAILDVNGDGALDLLIADSPYAPFSNQPLYQNVATVLGLAGADAKLAGAAHVIAHQVAIHANQVGGALDIANATFDSTQAAPTSIAGLARFTGQPASVFVGGLSPTTGVAGYDALDNAAGTGWFLQHMVAADLDPPGAPGAGSTDLVEVNGIGRLGTSLATAKTATPDFRGAICVRQVDPKNGGALGSPYFLDPTDMGALPTMAAVGDLLGPTRSTFAAIAKTYQAASGIGTPITSVAPTGTPDILVANTGDSSLTFYYQLQGPTYAAGSAEVPPVFASFNLPLKSLPGLSAIPAGDTIGVAIGDLDGDGWNDFIVVGQLSKTVLVFLFDPNPAHWTPGVPLPFVFGGALALPQILAGRATIADFNADGKNDIAVASRLTNEVLLYVNRGTAATGAPLFGPANQAPVPLHLAADLQCFDVKALDLNGDRRTDLVAANHLSIDVSVYYQTSPGSLSEKFLPVPTGQQPGIISAGALTGNGTQVVVPMSGDNTVVVYATDPTAGLAPLETYSLAQPGLSQPFETRVVDVNGDGKPDILVSMQIAIGAGGTVSGAWESIAGGPLASKVGPLGVGSVPSAAQFVSAGNLQGTASPGVPDVALSFAQANAVELFLAKPGGGYTSQVLSANLPSPRQLFVVDLDGDGNNDLVIPTGGSVTIFWGKPAGGGLDTASAPTVISTLPATDAVGAAVADVNHDGAFDIVLGGFVTATAAVVYQDPVVKRTFTVVALPGVLSPATQVAVGDLDGDGRSDVAFCWGSANLVAIYYQNPHPTGFQDTLLPPVTYQTAADPYGCVILDVDGNGKNDLVVSAKGANALNIFFQR